MVDLDVEPAGRFISLVLKELPVVISLGMDNGVHKELGKRINRLMILGNDGAQRKVFLPACAMLCAKSGLASWFGAGDAVKKIDCVSFSTTKRALSNVKDAQALFTLFAFALPLERLLERLLAVH